LYNYGCENMKKILIADDEYLVRLGLKTTINWTDNGFLIIGDAKNGKEAIELFDKFDPDILLTDIKMPLMDGFELIQTLKGRKKSLKIVILSHYDDFAYAQEALKLGASEYILKSDLSSESLLEILKKLSVEIDTTLGYNMKSERENPVATVENSCSLEELLEKMFYESFESKQVFLDYLHQYESLFQHNSIAFIYGIIQDIQNNGYDKEKEHLIWNIGNISSQEFEKKDMVHGFYFNKNCFVCLINFQYLREGEKIPEDLLNVCLRIKKNLKQFLDVELNIGLSKISNSIDELPDLFKQAKIAQEYCFYEPSGLVVFDQNMLVKKGNFPNINLDALKGLVLKSQSAKITSFINDIFSNLLETKRLEYAKDVFIDLLSFARIVSQELGLKMGPALNEVKFSYSNFDKLYNFDETKKYLTDIYYSIIEYNANNKSQTYSYIISKSMDFIKQNYHNNITLEDVANNVEISKSYLSLLFKQETGINFTTFLTNYRIEMAKKLLISSNDKIYEIAGKVGFENPYYFSKVFRGITGMTCKDFKKSCYGKQSSV
jgi:two-component system, response regulator YesN